MDIKKGESVSLIKRLDDKENRVDIIKKGFGKALSNFFSMRKHTPVSKDVLDDLFEMEKRTLITLTLLETIILYILAPLLGNIIFIWYGLILTITMWRLYNAYNYQSRPLLNSELVWHEKFVIHVWLTALLFSLLALFAMPKLDDYYQLFVFVVLVGISSGTVRSLAEDHRTAMGYLLIIMLPLAIEMLLLMRKDTWILTFLLILYLFTQIGLILSAYEQSRQLKKQKEEIQKAKNLLHQKREILHRFFEQSEDGLFTYNKNMKLLDCNKSFEALFNLKRGDTLGQSIFDMKDKHLVDMIRSALVDKIGRFSGTYKKMDGSELWLEIKCSPIYGKDGTTTGGVGIITDKTKEHLMIEEMEFLISHDPLTGALNRRGFKQFIKNMIRRKDHFSYYSLLFYLDLDKFKQANDIFGHDAGDLILKSVVTRLKSISRKIQGITRLGGDEFAFVIPMVSKSRFELENSIDQWIEVIEKNILQPYIFNNQEMDIGCSIGVVVVEPGETDIEELIRNADLAMLQAKSSDDHVSRYTPDMRRKYHQMYEMENLLKEAVKKESFIVHFQPILHLSDDRVVGAEAVVRWHHPERGLLLPKDFMPFASRFGLIPDIDRLVIKKAILQIGEWVRKGIFHIDYVSVNIDMKLVLNKNFIDYMMDSLEKYSIKPSQIKLEITENSLVNNFEDASKVIEKLYIQGIECAIDDFGTGYSSLSYLKKLPFTILKIDQEFVHDITVRIENVLLIQTIIDMANKLKFKIIVEGVETKKQKEIIKKIESNIEYQGFIETEPLDEEKFKDEYLLTKACFRR
jgi:diguanylate cyclase (GGDEF)-like protein/PAS domain S-box-containing protein